MSVPATTATPDTSHPHICWVLGFVGAVVSNWLHWALAHAQEVGGVLYMLGQAGTLLLVLIAVRHALKRPMPTKGRRKRKARGLVQRLAGAWYTLLDR